MKSNNQFHYIFLCSFFIFQLFNTSLTAQDGFIKGRISDNTGELSGISVFIAGPVTKVVLSDIDGTFSAKILPGKYVVSVNVLGYGEQKEEVVVRAGQTSIVDFELSLEIGGITSSATLFEQSALDAPATVYVIDKKKIRNRGYQNIQELLEDIPEVEIQKKSMAELKDNIGFRGITGNEKFIIYQDGIRITAATGDPHTVHTNYPLNNVKRVEVLVGPASAVYGVDAFSGIVNIITETGEEINGGRVMGSYGIYNTLDNSFIIGQKIKDVKISVSGNMYNSDEPDFNNVYQDDYQWFNDQYITNGNVIAGPFAPDTLTLTDDSRDFEMPSSSYFMNMTVDCYDFQMGYTRHGELHSSSVPARPEFSVYDEETSYGFTIESIYGKYTYESEDKKLKLRTIISHNSMENNVNSLFINTFTNYNKGYKYQYGKTLHFEQIGTYVFSPKINLAMGMSMEDVTALPKTGDLPVAFDKQISPEFQDLYYFGSNITDKDGNDLTIKQDFYYLQYRNFGGFMQWQFTPSEIININAAMRYDYNTRYGASINPRVTVLVKPTENFRIKAFYNEAFLSPSPWKAYQHFGSYVPQTNAQGEVTGLQSFFFHLPNPDLKPEKLRTFEGSMSYTKGGLLVGVNGFYNRVTNLINYFSQDTARNSFKGHPVFFVETPQNEGELVTYGGTAKIEYRRKFNTNMNFDSYLYYTYTDGNFNDGILPYTAKHAIRAGFSLSGKRFVVSPRAVYRTASYSAQIDPTSGNPFQNKANLMLNAHVAFHIVNTDKLKLSIFADGFNLLNTKYYGISNIGSEGFPLAPQDPLRGRLGIDVEF